MPRVLGGVGVFLWARYPCNQADPRTLVQAYLILRKSAKIFIALLDLVTSPSLLLIAIKSQLLIAIEG